MIFLFPASAHFSSLVNKTRRFHILLKGFQMLITPAGLKNKRQITTNCFISWGNTPGKADSNFQKTKHKIHYPRHNISWCWIETKAAEDSQGILILGFKQKSLINTEVKRKKKSQAYFPNINISLWSTKNIQIMKRSKYHRHSISGFSVAKAIKKSIH